MSSSASRRLRRMAAKKSAPRLVPVEYDGDRYLVDLSESATARAILTAWETKPVHAARDLLGPAQWATFRAKPRTSADFDDLLAAIRVAQR